MHRIQYFLLLLFCTTPAFAEDAPSFLNYYDTLLKENVKVTTRDGITFAGVDYKQWKKSIFHNKALLLLQNANPDKFLTKDEKMVFWINAYNFLTIDLIIKNNETESIKNLGTLFSSPWKAHEWKINGRNYTLDYIEHKILRKLGDPRVHMAIVCASISCPNLRGEAYVVEKLDSQLSEQITSFVNSSKGRKFVKEGMVISKIFDWFEDDFGGKENVLLFIRKYSKGKMGSSAITGYLDYNWNLNSIP